jgi:hypothetical protein
MTAAVLTNMPAAKSNKRHGSAENAGSRSPRGPWPILAESFMTAPSLYNRQFASFSAADVQIRG